MKGVLFISGFFFLISSLSHAQTEDLSGPPAVFSLEQHENLSEEGGVLPFLDITNFSADITNTSNVSDIPQTIKELITDKVFIGHLRFVSHRSNRHYDMTFDSEKMIKMQDEQEEKEILAAMLLEGVSGTEVASETSYIQNVNAEPISGDLGHDYKNFSVSMSQCLHDYNGIYGNDIAFIKVNDINSKDILFEGWLYKKRPSVNVFEHPVYSMKLISCK